MSIRFELTLGEEILDVEIWTDLYFEVHNRDLTYEVASAEFERVPTATARLWKSMKERPCGFLIGYLEDTDLMEEVEESKLLDFFILDVAEHVIHIYEDVTKDEYPRIAIHRTRSMLKAEEEEDGTARSKLKNSGILRKLFGRESFHAEKKEEAARSAVGAAIDAIEFVVQSIGDISETITFTANVISYAQSAVGLTVSEGENKQEHFEAIFKAFEKEHNWQARHLVQMLEAMQDDEDFTGLVTQ
jgi:hypothetical protein